jgi:hypothetical protein
MLSFATIAKAEAIDIETYDGGSFWKTPHSLATWKRMRTHPLRIRLRSSLQPTNRQRLLQILPRGTNARTYHSTDEPLSHPTISTRICHRAGTRAALRGDHHFGIGRHGLEQREDYAKQYNAH